MIFERDEEESEECLRMNPEPTTLVSGSPIKSIGALAHHQIIAKFQASLNPLQECNKICSVVGGLFQLEDLISS